MADVPSVPGVQDGHVLGVAQPHCHNCWDSGHVCEHHPHRPWFGVGGETCCGGAGQPCPSCCSPIPQDGTASIGMAFTPDRLRPTPPDGDDPRPTTGPPECHDFPAGCTCHLRDDLDYGEVYTPPADGCPVHTPWAYHGYTLDRPDAKE